MSLNAPLRVLVADDSPDVCARLCALLREAGLVVIGPAADGEAAWALFSAEAPDAVLLDFDMPHRNGLDLVRAMRRGGSTCLAIILTAHADRSIESQCLAGGADHFLNKTSQFEHAVEILSAFQKSRQG